VAPVLHRTTPTILGGHLTWLCGRTAPDDHLSSPPISVEDQIRILIRALDERHEDDVISRALEQRWTADDVPDEDEEIERYASDLRRAISGQPDDSPFVALADSAERVTAEILDHRGTSTARRRSA